MDESRQEALRLAVNAYGFKEPDRVIEAAQQYYEFLSGRTPPKPKKKK